MGFTGIMQCKCSTKTWNEKREESSYRLCSTKTWNELREESRYRYRLNASTHADLTLVCATAAQQISAESSPKFT